MSTPTFSFGTPSSSAAAGSQAATTAPAAGSLFGASASTPSFSFGASTGGGGPGAAQSGAGSTSLFGNLGSTGSAQKPSLFGSTGSTPASGTSAAPTATLFGQSGPGGGGGLFGGASNPTPTPGGLFGGSAGGSAQTTGTTTTPAPSLFGAPSAPASTAAAVSSAPAGSSPFGGGLFGGPAQTPASTSAAAPGGLFASAGKSLFGAPPTAATSAPATTTPAKPLFGGLSTTPLGAPPSEKPASTNLFGSATVQPSTSTTQPAQAGTQSAAPLFGQTAKPSLFSATPSIPTTQASASGSGSTPMLGSSVQNQTSGTTGSLFPAAGGAAGGILGQTKPAQASNIFGGSSSAPAPQATPATTAATPSFFQLKPTDPATTTAPGLFGSNSTTATAAGTGSSTTASTGSLFPQLGTSTTTTSAAPSSSQAPSLFTPVTTTANGTSAPSQNPGLFPTAPSTTATSSSAATIPATGTTAGLSFPSTSTTDTASALKPADSGLGASTSAPQISNTSTSNMNNSTLGPLPQLPRLKNKTMDEIISRWATDLDKYQKEFKSQAQRVAKWDEMLVENGKKIQQLYLDTYEAERASNEIDRQLQVVESQQEELAAWLDRYENEVEEMFSKQVGQNEQLAGPDQERERTYKLAEQLTDRLDDMGKDLTKMIKEINDISGSINKSGKPDDPLSQIVRVLNGHLTELQWIDSNAAALQAKVAAAQKAGANLGSTSGAGEGDAPDGFYRSYLSRR